MTGPFSWPLILGVGLAVLLILGFLSVVLARLYKRRQRRRALFTVIDGVSSAHLRDVVLPDGNEGWFHLDFLLRTPEGLLVVDLRDVAGLIFGSEQMTEWTVMQKTRRFTFSNPLNSLYDRIAVVRGLVGEDVQVDGRVVFSDRGTFPKGRPRSVTTLADLADTLGTAGLDADTSRERLDAAWAAVTKAASPSPLKRR